MTPTQAATIAQRAQRQLSADRRSCHITAEELRDLSAAYLDAMDRLGQVAEIARQAVIGTACGTCYLEQLREIHKLAN